MDAQKALTEYFKQISYYAKKGKLTAQTVRDAAAATDTSEIMDAILCHAEGHGINPENELAELWAARAAAQADETAQKRKEDIKSTAVKMGERLESLIATIDTTTSEELTAIISDIGADVSGLTTTAAKVNRFPSWIDYETAWQKDNDFYFSPALFDRLPFPDGTVSYIGARTGRGKTTVMVNIGIEAIFSDKPRRVLFISLEESHKQILRRFSLCLAYRNADETTRQKLLTIINPYTQKKDPKNAYKNWKKGWSISVKEYGNGASAFVKAISESDKEIKSAIETGNLVYFDGIGAPLPEILAVIRARKKGDIVLLDYVQRMPSAGNTYSANPDLDRIRHASAKLFEIAHQTECVIISGAQFNREGYKGIQRKDDEFSDADFRGCGDLEQDGHNLLGIGRNETKTITYYGIMKSREGEIMDTLFPLKFAGGYSYMAHAGQTFSPQSKNSGARKGKVKANSKTPVEETAEVFTMEDLKKDGIL